MNSLKTITLVAVMAAVGYGVYSSLNKRPPAEPPVAMPEDWNSGPQVQLPATSTNTPPVTLTPGTGGAPPFVQSPAAENPFPSSTGNAATPQMPSPLGGALDPALSSPLAPASAPTTSVTPPLPGTVQASYGDGPNSTMPTGPRGNEGYAVTGDQPLPNSSADAAVGDIHTQFGRAFDAAQVQADLGKLSEAHLELSQWYDHPELSEGESRQLIEMLDRLAGTVIYSHRHHLLEKPYETKPGETLEQIAQQHQVPWQLLAKINGLDDPAAVRPGQPLKVLRGPFNAVVDARNYRLTLFLQGRYAGRFPIGVGRDMPKGDGSNDFEVQGVYANPIYRGQDIVIPAQDPTNPYGRVWIDLGQQMGIHGTNDPQQVGTNTGRGCILLRPADITHVQDILTVGSRVLVRR